MNEQDNGLTLQRLAHRLEALERENERMRSENAELRDEVAALSGSERSQAVEPAFEGRVSRRALLSKAGAAAVAAVAAGTLLGTREAKASHFPTDLIEADLVRTHFLEATSSSSSFGGISAWASSNTSPTVNATNTGSKPAVEAANTAAGEGILGKSTNGTGVDGRGMIGVWGRSGHEGRPAVYGEHFNTFPGSGVVGDGVGPDYAGVLGRNSNGTGVWGQSSKSGYSGVYGQHTGDLGFGLVGDGKGGGAGVLGRNSGGEGVRGEGSNQAEVAGVRGLGKTGVWGSTSAAGYSGVYGEHSGSSGFGVVGDGEGSSTAGVLGRNSGGDGVQGEGANGVHGKATSGYGGLFEGGKAQLRIAPKGTAGRPTTGAHSKGELYMDSAAALFVCTASGTPGKWRKVTTTLV